MAVYNDSDLGKLLEHHIQEGVKAAAEPVVQEAVAKFEKGLRERVESVALRWASDYKVETRETRVQIEFNVSDLKRGL